MKQLENTKEREWAKSLRTSISKGENEGDVEVKRNLTVDGSFILGGTKPLTIKTFTGTPKECIEKIKDRTWICATYLISFHITPTASIRIKIPIFWNDTFFYYFNSTMDMSVIGFNIDNADDLITLYGLTTF